MKKNILSFFLIISSLSYVFANSALFSDSQYGYDSTPTVATITTADIPEGSTITDVLVTTSFGSQSYIDNWYDIHLNINGTDYQNVGFLSAQSYIDLNGLGPNGLTVTATTEDLDDYSDGSTLALSVEVVYDPPAGTPDTPLLTSPANGAINVAVDVYLEWTTGNETDHAVLYLADNAEFTDAIIENPATSPYSPTLDFDSTYYWKVVAVGPTGTEVSSLVWSFTTEYGIAIVPYPENFDAAEAGAQPAGWISLNDTGNNYATTYVSASNAVSGTRSYRLYNSGATTGNLIGSTPKIENAGNRVRFMAKTISTGTIPLFVGTMTDATDGTTFTRLDSLLLTSDYTQYIVDLPDDGAEDHVSFKHGFGGTNKQIYIDDVNIEAIPITNLNLNNNSTHISLTPSIGFDINPYYQYYELYFGANPNPETAIIPFSAVSNPISYTFTDSLEYFTDYYWTIVLYDENYEFTIVNFTFKTRPELDGLGTQENPYLVSNLADLIRISTDQYYWDKHFQQIADIDASATSDLNDGAGFLPIGTNDNRFTGTYDGQGFIISDLYINQINTMGVGLFGYVSNASLSNLGIVNATISGNSEVGCLGGRISGTEISKCFMTGTVNGNNDYTGGLIGNSSNSSIDNCFSFGDVTGSNFVGGLIGKIDHSTVMSIYSTVEVNGDSYVGGLLGNNYNNTSTITNSFWDIETSGQTSNTGGTGKTTAQMKDINTYQNAGWDFIGEDENGIEDIWIIQANINSGYPSLINSHTLPNYAIYSYPANELSTFALTDQLAWAPDHFELATGYKLNLGTDNPPSNAVSHEDLGLVTSYEYANLQANTTYYWQVIPYNDNGNAEDCPIWSFTTGSANIVGVGSGNNTSVHLPIDHTKKRSYSQSIYLQSELNLANRQIEKLSFYLADDFNLAGANQWKVYLGHTNKNEFASTNDWLLANQGLNQVADVTFPDSTNIGWLEIELDTPFSYNNTDNLMVGVIEYSSETSNYLDFYTCETESNRSLNFAHDSAIPNPNIPYSGQMFTSIPKINFTFSEPTTRFTGLVKNSENTPLDNASVYIEELGTFPTNTLGEFNIDNVETGSYQLVVSAPWYETQTMEFEVIEGEDNYLEITLLEELLPANNVIAILAEDLSNVNVTWSAPVISREANLSKGRASKAKENLSQGYDPEQRTGQPEVLYNLYRYGAGDEASPENWVELATNLEVLTYADNSFSTLELGSYYWAVEAVYANDRLADATISNEILKQPYLESTIVEQIDFGVVYLTNESDYSQIILTNSGTGDLTLNAITCEEPAFNLVYDQAELVVEPDSTLTIQVNFAPTNPGVYMEDLIITNNSINEPNYTITLRGVCEYLPPKDPENVELIMSGNTGNISWEAVTEDINNNPIAPDLYIVYYNGHNADVDYGFYFLASTTELSYNHINVGLFSQFMLYQVKAYVDVDNALLSQIEDLVAQRQQLSMKEVESLIRNRKGKAILKD